MATGVKGPNFGAHVVKMAKTIEAGSVATVGKAAAAAASHHQAVIDRDTGGDGKLSGVNAAKGRPGNTKVGVTVKVDKRQTSPSAVIKATGPLQIINNDTAGHVIRSAYLSGKGRKGFIGPSLPGQFSARKKGQIGPVLSTKAVLNIPGVGFRASARHPGTKGKQTWQVGAKRAAPAIQQQMSRRTHNVIKGAAKP